MDLLATAAMTMQEPETASKVLSSATQLYSQPNNGSISSVPRASLIRASSSKSSLDSYATRNSGSTEGNSAMDECTDEVSENDGAAGSAGAIATTAVEVDDCFSDAEVLNRIEVFECPEGYCRARVPDAKPGRSVMYDYGVVCRHISTMEERWFCLANESCAKNSSLGIGGILTVRSAAMKTSSKFCISHLRIMHQKEFPCSRNLKLTNRVEEQKCVYRPNANGQAEPPHDPSFNRKEAISRFVCPQGFIIQPAGRSIINLYGIRCCSTNSSETRWYCYCDANCAVSGTCISIQGFTSTNAVAHLREVHGVLTTRAENKLKRKILEISDTAVAAPQANVYPNAYQPQPPPPLLLMGHPINPYMRYQGYVPQMPPPGVAPHHPMYPPMHATYAGAPVGMPIPAPAAATSEHESALAAPDFAHKMMQQCYDSEGRYSIAQAIDAFLAPAGFSKDLDSAATKRSIIYKYGCKAIHNQTFALRWFCLASPDCAEKSFTGSCGLSMKGDATTNCVNHLRSFHPSLLKSDGNYGAVFNNRHNVKMPSRPPSVPSSPPPSLSTEASSSSLLSSATATASAAAATSATK